MKGGWKLTAILAAAIAGGWLLLIVAPAAFYEIAHENGPIESVGTLFFLAAAAVFGWGAFRLTRHRDVAFATRRSIIGALLALIFLFAFLEEISWGQQVFDWRTPEAFGENIQGETNLHNNPRFDCHVGCSGFLILRSADGRIVFDMQRGFTLGVLGLAFVVPLVAAGPRRLRKAIATLGLPVATLWVGALAIGNFVLSRLAMMVHDESRGTIASRELMESGWGIIAFLIAATSLPKVEQFYRHRRWEPDATVGTDRTGPAGVRLVV